ncbi:formate dehydrogenase accessory sulfurtransferase FdhD [Paenibacillus chibensis]|uniref:formate dehydrogenase accessory sulfurtransferase FdhD n=1 Tax=Paenibacillus chibensis TaxID=59846 RepID=UPI000FD85EA5|nr:formate dehydrogenase accessory sulfurtransferase FdhD [Paenibacillus chibensis]MEC0372557.1 formate dehydrogenase accessory sulfurtransferase FdhD [Paenibacillus chibensis]
MRAVTHEKGNIIRYEQGQITNKTDLVVAEHPVTIKINGEEFATLVCTPEYIEDMAVGYLASEGVISGIDEIQDLWVQEDEGFVHATVSRWSPLHRQLYSKRYVTSCCGASRQGFVFFNDAKTAKRLHDVPVELSFDDAFRLVKEMQANAEIFSQTGGVHNAALCDRSGIILERMDIGRHNALDKIYGYCLKHSIPMNDKIIVFSGRISSEILLKVAKIGCGVILSKSAPTELALELAESLGITTVGFVRGSSCNVYTHPQRILECREQPDKHTEIEN